MRKYPVHLRTYVDSIRGKTYEEIHGAEEAARLRSVRSEGNRKRVWKEESKGKLRQQGPRLSKVKKDWWATKSTEERIQLTLKMRRAVSLKRPTKIEALTESVLKELEISSVAQKPLGKFLVDFYLPDLKVAIECDGEHWHSSPEAKASDAKRDKYLFSEGLSIIRLTGKQINFNVRSYLILNLFALNGWVA